MVINMNAVDDKKNITSNKTNGINDAENRQILKSNESNGTNVGLVACGSSKVDECNVNISLDIKVNGSSPGSSKRHQTNGAYTRAKSSSCSTCVSEDRLSDTRDEPASFNPEHVPNETSRESEVRSVVPENRVEPHLNNASCSSGVQKQSKPKSSSDYCNSSSEDEECCIYTYKGDANQMADLPSSFFRMDLIPPRPNAASRDSSPDMDYLEMDFDPGPSNDRDSSSDSEIDEGAVLEGPFEPEAIVLPAPSPQQIRDPSPEPQEAAQAEANVHRSQSPLPLPSSSPVCYLRRQTSPDLTGPVSRPAILSVPASPLQQWAEQDAPQETPQPYCYCIATKFSPVSIDENFNEGDSDTMVWKEVEAREKQVTQIGVSACGATAVINALAGLNVPFTVADVKQHVATRFRSDSAPVVEYLVSRCHAGATHLDMIRGLQGASHDAVYARFFPMYPQRNISLTHWLSHWIRKGAVGIVTLNLQRGVPAGTEIPDVWHHQMIHGVSAQGIHLTNPLEVVSEAQLWRQLASPSVLLVRREDVLSRWTPDTPLHPLAHPTRPLWRKMNVLGQVVNVIRESRNITSTTRHISIPASYCGGFTLAILRSNTACEELRTAPQLPVDPFAPS